MNQQLTFADSEFSSKRRQTRKEIFLSRMDKLLPWPQLLEVIEPFYPKAGNGRRPYALETMFRIHCMQQWYNLGDEAMEDALYEIDKDSTDTHLAASETEFAENGPALAHVAENLNFESSLVQFSIYGRYVEEVMRYDLF